MRRGENRSERRGQEKQTLNLSKFTEEVSMAMFLLISVSRRETSAEAATLLLETVPASLGARCRTKSQA
jgi:hypothetical protein